MPMGIVNDADFKNEVTRLDKPSEVIKPPHRGRSEGDVNVPDSLRKVIGETSVIDGRKSALQLAADFGISPSSVSAYANGSTSTDSYNKQPNLPVLNNARGRVAKTAMNKLRRAMHHMTDAKLADASIKTLAGVARDMSAVVKNMEPEPPKQQTDSGPTFVFYAPQIIKEEVFDVVYAKD